MTYWSAKRHITFIIVLILYLHTVYSKKCPPSASILPCRCMLNKMELQMWCSHSNLPQVMNGIQLISKKFKEEIDELILENNYLPALTAKFFSSLKIRRLMLRHNNIERISHTWLSGLEDTISEIFIVENQLRSIAIESFMNLKQIEAITIQSNSLKRIPSFFGLTTLKYVNIQSKSFSEIGKGTFYGTENLKSLHINDGKNFTDIKVNLISDLKNLENLDLSRNSIARIHIRGLYNLPSLKFLNLSQNQINDIKIVGRVVRNLEHLESLILDGNYVNVLNEGAFVDLPALRELSLNDNQIIDIQYGAFYKTPNLKIIYLQNNNIKHIHPESFLQPSGTGVENIYLSNNEISQVKELKSLLDALPMLKFLDLSNNRITKIAYGALRGHGSIEQLYLDNNLIHTIDQDALLAMPALRELRLSNNNLSDSLSLPFWNLPQLKGLDLSRNQLNKLDKLLFSGTPLLRRIDLSQNNITDINPGLFHQTPYLEFINISSNDISYINPITFQKLNRLFEIDVSYNNLNEMISGLPEVVERISLKGNQINLIPNALSIQYFNLPNLRVLDISENMIESIPKQSFIFLRELKILSLASNKIRTLDNITFVGAHQLEMLHLQDNQIHDIQDGCFDFSKALQDLNLRGNKLQVLTSRIFSNNSFLEQLDLSNNHIKMISSKTFKGLRLLSYLDLSGNMLSNIPESLSYLENLKMIDLSSNYLRNLPGNLVNSWKNIIELRISNNKINELQTGNIENLDKLLYLDLSSNEIELIDVKSIHNLPNLQELVLADNRIEKLKDYTFEMLPNLQAIHLQFNLLRILSPKWFDDPSNLVYLNLSSNNLLNINDANIEDATNLEVLDLTKNSLRTIESTQLKKLTWLVELKLDDNKICKIVGSPFENMPRLRVLSLRNNQLSRLPEYVFRTLRENMAVLDVNGNPLLCNCDIMWLRVWLEENKLSNIGPRCANGSYLEDLRFNNSECISTLHKSYTLANKQDNLLFSESETCQIDSGINNHKENQYFVDKSEYFYDQYVDISSDYNTSPKNILSNNISHNSKPTKLPQTVIKDYNKRPTQTTPFNSSPFTFFGYPLPSLNMGNIFNMGRNANGGGLKEIRTIHGKYPVIQDFKKSTSFEEQDAQNISVKPTSIENNFNLTEIIPQFVERNGFIPMIPQLSSRHSNIENYSFDLIDAKDKTTLASPINDSHQFPKKEFYISEEMKPPTLQTIINQNPPNNKNIYKFTNTDQSYAPNKLTPFASSDNQTYDSRHSSVSLEVLPTSVISDEKSQNRTPKSSNFHNSSSSNYFFNSRPIKPALITKIYAPFSHQASIDKNNQNISTTVATAAIYQKTSNSKFSSSEERSKIFEPVNPVVRNTSHWYYEFYVKPSTSENPNQKSSSSKRHKFKMNVISLSFVVYLILKT